MKRKLFFGIGIATLMMGVAACGGGEEESTDETTDKDTTQTEEVVEAVTYQVDTAQSKINWYSMDGEEKAHNGYVKVLEGSYTVEGDKITEASMTINMNTITVVDDAGGEKLEGHLMSPDFFDVNQYAKATFNFSKHEEGMIHGNLNVAGLDFPVEAPVTLGEGKVDVQDFKIDMVQLPFFQEEREKAPEKEWHNTNIGFTATIVAQQ